MFSDDIEPIRFSIDGEWMIDQIVDWFGFDFKAEKKGDKFIIAVNASPNAMEYWAMQYLNHIEILSPRHLREKLTRNIQCAEQKYTGETV